MGLTHQNYLKGQINLEEERLVAVEADLNTAPTTEQRNSLDNRARQLTQKIDKLYRELKKDERQSDFVEPIYLEQPGSDVSLPAKEYAMREVVEEEIEGKQSNNTEEVNSNSERYSQESFTNSSENDDPNWVFYQSDNDSDHVEEDFPIYNFNQQKPGDASLGCAVLIGICGLWFAWSSISSWHQSDNIKKIQSKVVAQEGTIIGHDGTNKYQIFLDTYERNGGGKKLGQPNGFLESNQDLNGAACTMKLPLPCFKIQKFSGGSEEKGAIFQSSNDSKAYWVGGDFWETFEAINSKRNITIEPISDREEYAKWWKQKFSNQNTQPGCTAIFKIETQIFYVDDEIGCHYFHNEGGEKGRLGFPTKNPENRSNSFGVQWAFIKQYFSNGCIEYDAMKNVTTTKTPLTNCSK